ncbi:unnamed protein product [Prunus armeniaca]
MYINTPKMKHPVFQMYPTKAAGPDGMPLVFFQKYWHIVGNDMSRAIINFLSSGRLLHKINFTHVVLIPKVKNPKDMTQLWPISLRNILFKIASNVLANRLKIILPSLISSSQSAFVSSRLISDNSILAAEIIHCLRSRRRGKKGLLALKLDMSKAYDRIEWPFLEQMMTKLGFAEQWAKRDGHLARVSICRGAPPINHLMFVNDCYLFARANVGDCGTIKEALPWYEKVSGQKVNLQKSAICLSKNVKRQDQLDLAASLGVSCAYHYDKYLGLPMVVDRNKGSLFAHLKERLGKKLYSWKGKLLSSAGKEILIKTVAQALPLYSMSVYLLPKYFCDDLNSLITDFWWNENNGDRKIHWLAWGFANPKILGAWASGSRWQVGSGAEIDIWKDPWLPRPSTFRVISPKPNSYVVTKVNELILDHPRRWNISLLSNLLYPPDVDVIRTLLLSFHHRDDALIWHVDKKG